jgi:hypothetical protein
MRNKKEWDLETLLSIVGFVFELVRVTVNALRERNGTVDHLRRLLKEPELVNKVFDLIVEPMKEIEIVFTVIVDYTKSLEAMIEDGHYDSKDSDITVDNFPVVGSSQVAVDLKLIRRGKNKSTTDVLADLDRRGLRPATLPELLAFGAKYPDEQRKYPIIALGSIGACRINSRSVVYLIEDAGSRKLDVSSFECKWFSHCCFLAAKK